MGRETAVLFAREGARVVASARREQRLIELRAQLAGEGHVIEIYPADASDVAAMNGLASFAQGAFGGVDILVYATGTNTPDRALTRLTPAVWDMMLSVNLNGAYYATQAVLPIMRDLSGGEAWAGGVSRGDSRRGERERDSHLRGVSRACGYGNSGEAAGEAFCGDAGEGAARGGCGGTGGVDREAARADVGAGSAFVPGGDLGAGSSFFERHHSVIAGNETIREDCRFVIERAL
jgi:hypothetical protein